MKTLLLGALLAASALARADAPKLSTRAAKLGREARVFVLDKEAPPMDKTVPLSRTRPALKNK